MQSYCIFPLKQNQKVMKTSFTAHFTAHSLSRDDESTGISSPTRNASLPAFPPNSILQASLLRPHKQKHSKANPVPSSYMQNPENTSHLSVTSAHPQSGNLPFWPHPPTRGPITFIPISDPPLPRGDEISENREDLVEVLCFPGEISARECQVKDGLSLTERQQLKKIREELEITIDEESTSVGEIYEAPEVPLVPFVEFQCNRNNISMNRNIFSSNHGAVQNQKQRIRWTTELHELFIEAVNKLGGAESATPKGILVLMKVDGLNIYHVKSHLQKYRLAKKVRLEFKHDKGASSSKEKMQASSENDSDLHIEREAQLETQRMQIELQKLLHEQLKDLQKRIERQGEQLKKILEQQEKPGSNLFPLNGFPTSNLISESEQALLCSFPGTSADQEE